MTEWHWGMANNVTKEVRLQELQWKVLHNIYPTNILLSKMGVARNSHCTYCTNEIDYIEHFFFSCERIAPIWRKVEQTCSDYCKQKITIRPEQAILGYHDKDMLVANLQMINHVILVAKMCIGKFKYGKPLDIIVMFESELLMRGKYIFQ